VEGKGKFISLYFLDRSSFEREITYVFIVGRVEGWAYEIKDGEGEKGWKGRVSLFHYRYIF
jgi:hypothetical protein